MATNYSDDVALLKEELAQFLLAEITSAQGGAAFRREVGDQVAAVIDQILDERLKPVLAGLDRQASEHTRQTKAMIDDALRDVSPATGVVSAVSEQKLADIAARLDDVRQRMARLEETAKPKPSGPAATAQPIRAAGRTDERVALTPAPARPSSFPAWIAWALLVLVLLIAAGVGNLYYERLNAAPAPVPQTVAPSTVTGSATSPPATTTTQAPLPQTQPVSPPGQTPPAAIPPQTQAAIAPVTPKPAPFAPDHAASPPARSHVPADIAIERGWLAAQPYAVDTRLARRVGVTDALPTLKSIFCDNTLVCSSDQLFGGSDARQLIALQMIMSQIGDRFCAPRRSVGVTGSLTGAGLADLSAIAACAGGNPAHCVENQNTVCAPDADTVQAGSTAARAALLRWALWKTGSS